jgi:hypothetical protein
MEKKRKLSELTLPELETLYRLLDEGRIDGMSTKRIEAEAGDGFGGKTLWVSRLKYRKKELENISASICDKAHEIDYEVYI